MDVKINTNGQRKFQRKSRKAKRRVPKTEMVEIVETNKPAKRRNNRAIRRPQRNPQLVPPTSKASRTRSSITKSLTQITRGGAQTMPNVGLTMAERLALSVAMPAAGVLYRWPSLSEQPTGLAGPWARYQVPPITGSNHQPFAAVFRNPCRAAVIYDANESAASYQYVALGRDDEDRDVSSSWDLDTTTALLPMIIPSFNSSYPYAPHGPILFCGSVQDSDNYWFWVDQNLHVQALVPAAQTMSVYVDFYSDGVIIEQVASAVLTNGTPSHDFVVDSDLNDSGYYSLRYSCTAPVIDVAVALSGNGSVYAHKAIPGLAANMASASAIRMMGISLMYTNKASVDYLGGSIAGYQVPASLEWQNYVSFDQVNELQGSDTRDARRGMYGFIKPVDETDFEFLKPDEFLVKLDQSGNVLDCYYPLMSHRPFLVMATDLTALQTAGYWTFAFSIEYQTTDVWREIASPSLPVNQGDLALSALKQIDQFHENTTHIKKVLDGVMKFVGKGMDLYNSYGPPMAALARLLL